MPHAQRRLEAQALEGHQIERLRFRGGGVYIVAIGDVAPEMMPAGGEQCFVQAEALRFRDTPRRQPFAANLIDMDERLLEERHRDAGTSEHRRERSAADSRTDDYDLRISVCSHVTRPIPRAAPSRLSGQVCRIPR